MALEIDSIVSLPSPTHPFARAMLLHSCTLSKDLTAALQTMLVLAYSTSYFQEVAALAPDWACKRGMVLLVGKFTPFIKPSASGRPRLTCLKCLFQNSNVQIILILYSFSSLAFTIMSQRTIHLACISSLYNQS